MPLPPLRPPKQLSFAVVLFTFELLWHPILESPVSTTPRGGKEAESGAMRDKALVERGSNLPRVKNSGPFKTCAREHTAPLPPLRTAEE